MRSRREMLRDIHEAQEAWLTHLTFQIMMERGYWHCPFKDKPVTQFNELASDDQLAILNCQIIPPDMAVSMLAMTIEMIRDDAKPVVSKQERITPYAGDIDERIYRSYAHFISQ